MSVFCRKIFSQGDKVTRWSMLKESTFVEFVRKIRGTALDPKRSTIEQCFPQQKPCLDAAKSWILANEHVLDDHFPIGKKKIPTSLRGLSTIGIKWVSWGESGGLSVDQVKCLMVSQMFVRLSPKFRRFSLVELNPHWEFFIPEKWCYPRWINVFFLFQFDSYSFRWS